MQEIKLKYISTTQNFDILDIYLESATISPESIKNLNFEYQNTEKTLIINGKSPNWLIAFIVNQLSNKVKEVAIHNARDGAVIIASNNNSIGSIIPIDSFINFLPKHLSQPKNQDFCYSHQKTIAFIGPPHSGKSIFINILKDEIISRKSNDFIQRDFYILRACPDGEGDWSNEISPDYCKIIRYKNSFDDAFVNKITSHLESIKKIKSMVFVDCGGIIDKKNQAVLNLCSHSIIISKDKYLIKEWIGASKSSNLEIIAAIHSVLKNTSEILSVEPFAFEFGELSRNKNKFPCIPELLFTNLFK